MEKKYSVIIEFHKGPARMIPSNSEAKKVNEGILKIDNKFYNLINVKSFTTIKNIEII
ncbi:hypothetical protein [Psychrobacillus sp.]|uniref:hypothetical protein n=1 Tax=Psychrobacillus sp. TaxID=1871623 RepID=UPI0028BEEBDB|nr:hypothetical protein [Psychrobacillus sp.]